MTTKLIYILAAVLLAFASAGAGGRQTTHAGEKIQVVYREQTSGEWQMFVFGAHCPTEQNMQVIYPKDAETQPIEIECDAAGGAGKAGPAALAQGKAARR